jgi:hypothetical protein
LKQLSHELVEVEVLERGTYLGEETGFCAQPSMLGYLDLKLAEANQRVVITLSGFLLRLL